MKANGDDDDTLLSGFPGMQAQGDGLLGWGGGDGWTTGSRARGREAR